MANPFPVTSITTGKKPDGSWPVRKEIDDFMLENNKQQVFLFFEAFSRLQARGAGEALSYFQIAGEYY